MSDPFNPRTHPTHIKFPGAEVRYKSKGPTLALDKSCRSGFSYHRSYPRRHTKNRIAIPTHYQGRGNLIPAYD